MTIYEYRCPECGPFDARLPIGTAPAVRDCSECHRPARRVFSSPYLSRMPSALAAALAREERGREAPEVVREPVGRRRQPPARLPRP